MDLTGAKCGGCGYDLSTKNEGSIEIGPKATNEKIKNNEDFILLDVRHPNENELTKIENSVLIPLNELPNRLNELDKKKQIICYCRTGNRSLHSARFLRQKGFTDAKNLKGGIHLWHDEVDSSKVKY
ncbi:sulfurtransferase [Candidatus Woesearchaeota archaeon]|nr:sulfurtransferase [Candidatus Woesearchaeota archaeon]